MFFSSEAGGDSSLWPTLGSVLSRTGPVLGLGWASTFRSVSIGPCGSGNIADVALSLTLSKRSGPAEEQFGSSHDPAHGHVVHFLSAGPQGQGWIGKWARADVHVGATAVQGPLGGRMIKRPGFSPIHPHCLSMEQGREVQVWHCNNNLRN